MAAEICVWPLGEADRDLPIERVYQRMLSGSSDRGQEKLHAALQDLHASYGEEASPTKGSFPGLARITGSVLRIAVRWDRIAEVGKVVQPLTERYELALYVPDARALGCDPSAPDWDGLQATAQDQLAEAWRIGHHTQGGSPDEP